MAHLQTSMFEGFEVGNKITKEEYEAALPDLRVDLVVRTTEGDDLLLLRKIEKRHAAWFEQRIERALAIEDSPVEGER